MRNLKLLSLTDDDPAVMTTNIENSISDTENGNNYFLVFLFSFNFVFRR
jgi:hypothetical protein